MIGNTGMHCPIHFTLSDTKAIGDPPALPSEQVGFQITYSCIQFSLSWACPRSDWLSIPYYNVMNNNTLGWILYSEQSTFRMIGKIFFPLKLYMIFFIFLWPFSLNCIHLGMALCTMRFWIHPIFMRYPHYANLRCFSVLHPPSPRPRNSNTNFPFSFPSHSLLPRFTCFLFLISAFSLIFILISAIFLIFIFL